jgi:hypothetical protein
MDRWRDYLSRRPAGARQQAVKALAVLIATAGLAILVAVITDQAWPPVVIAIIGTIPALYLAFLAVPGIINPPEPAPAARPVFGRPVGWWNPVELGVHKVIGGGPLPPYMLRIHDEALTAVLDPHVPASRLVVIRGGSSTGKTRAAWEAIARGQFANWQLDYPRDPAALKKRLDVGVPPRTVLWLGELRQYTDSDGGGQVIGRLADLLDGENRLLITTMWPEQWEAYREAARQEQSPSPAGTAGRLLAQLPELADPAQARVDPSRGGVIDVPAGFTPAELEAAVNTGEPLLTEAAAAAGRGGRVTQYLAGVPALLDRYQATGGDPYGQALITAAMDASRFGHADPLSAAFLLDAAVGYLTDSQRTLDVATWRERALEWACTELRGAVRAVQPVPPAEGAGIAGYRIADWLEQYGLRTRQKETGPPSLWDALAAHSAATGDLTRLGESARQRGLKRHAVTLWTKAASAGDIHASQGLLSCLGRPSEADFHRAARWVAVMSTLDDSRAVAGLLHQLVESGDDDAIATLLARDPVAFVGLDDPQGIAYLIEALQTVGASDAIAKLAARAASDVSLSNPPGVAELLNMLDNVDAGDAVAVLAARAAAHADIEPTGRVAGLLYALVDANPPGDVASVLVARAASDVSLAYPSHVAEVMDALAAIGAGDAIDALLDREPESNTSIDDTGGVAELLQALTRAGADEAVIVLGARAAAHASLGSPSDVAYLLEALATAGASQAIDILLARKPAVHVGLNHTRGVIELMKTLKEAGDGDAVAELAARAAAKSSLYQPWDVAWLLQALASVGAHEAVGALLARNPATHVSLHDVGGIRGLLRELMRIGASAGMAELAARAGPYANLDHPTDGAVAALENTLREAGASEMADILAARAAIHARQVQASRSLYGCEPDGSPSPPWAWREP